LEDWTRGRDYKRWQVNAISTEDTRYRSGRSSWGKEESGKWVDEPEPECDDDCERIELDFASSFCVWYSEGRG